MKKSMILLLTVVLVFAFASAAYANTDDWNPAGPTYRTDLTGATPHGSYLTTGDECEVCHSPHQAGTGSTSYKLLRGADAASACDYCHVGSAAAAGAAYTVYTVGGSVAKDGINGHEIGAFTDIPDVDLAAEDAGVIAAVGTSLECFDCHAVHGAGAVATITSVQGITLQNPKGAILKANANGDATAATTYNGFCEECHNLNAGETYNVAMITHYMGEEDAVASPRGTDAVAGVGSPNCWSCHVASSDAAAAGYKWPHNSYGVALINMDQDGALGVADYANLAVAIDADSIDANCLMCHSQVGIDY